jgi:predicted house-cleaning noncanonical NTP pyrophosphatase (MazG superfamily)
MFAVKNINVTSMKKLQNKKVSNIVISPKITRSPFSIPDSPKYISVNAIEKSTNIYYLKKLEHEYDEFLENRCQILLLLNVIDEVFEIRDSLIMRINALRRQEKHRQMRDNYRDFITNI